MKTEFYTGSLDSIVHWLNIQSNREIDGHFFSAHGIRVLPQGIMAQAVFLTPEEEKEGLINQGLTNEEDDD